jgi:hypothetical protein
VNSYVLRGNTSWHPDFERDVGEFGQCDGLVMAVYLEPLDGSSGALRVLPGSHVNPFHADVFDEVQSAALPFGGAAAEWPCHICACQPNGVGRSVFDPPPCLPLSLSLSLSLFLSVLVTEMHWYYSGSAHADIVIWNSHIWHASLGCVSDIHCCHYYARTLSAVQHGGFVC